MVSKQVPAAGHPPTLENCLKNEGTGLSGPIYFTPHQRTLTKNLFATSKKLISVSAAVHMKMSSTQPFHYGICISNTLYVIHIHDKPKLDIPNLKF